MREHLQPIVRQTTNEHYLSKAIQNEIINVIGSKFKIKL